MEMACQIDFFNKMAKTWDQTCKHDIEKVETILDFTQIREGIIVALAGF